MKEVIFQTKTLTKQIKQSNVYQHYLRANAELKKDQVLYEQFCELRKRNYELQVLSSGRNLFDEVNSLNNDNLQLLNEPLVKDYMVAEQRLCKMLRFVLDSITEELDLNIDFFE